jgi:hypothetical protein
LIYKQQGALQKALLLFFLEGGNLRQDTSGFAWGKPQKAGSLKKMGLVLTTAIVRAGLCACPHRGNHRGIAPTKDGRCYDQAPKIKWRHKKF